MTYEIADRARRRTQMFIYFSVVALIGIVSLVVIITAVTRGDESADNAAEAPTTTDAMVQQQQPLNLGTAPAGSNAPNVSAQSSPNSDITWRFGPTNMLPYSTSAGPRVVANGRAAGFAHTQSGAVMAAIHIYARAQAAAGSEIFSPTIRGQVDGIQADALLAYCSEEYKAALDSNPGIRNGAPYPVTAGADYWAYKIEKYSPDSANVVIAFKPKSAQGNSTEHTGIRLDVRWFPESNDWALVAPDQTSELQGWASAKLQPNFPINGFFVFPRGGEKQ